MKIAQTLAFFFLALAPVLNTSAQPNTVTSQPVSVELKLEPAEVVPGETFEALVHFTIPKPWHIYWKNPGDAGLPTKVTLELPEDYVAEDIVWPPHHTFIQPGNLTGYGYEDEVTLVVPVTVALTAKKGALIPIKADVRWLSCSNLCIPGRATLSGSISISNK